MDQPNRLMVAVGVCVVLTAPCLSLGVHWTPPSWNVSQRCDGIRPGVGPADSPDTEIRMLPAWD
jgi:hypothetical protein